MNNSITVVKSWPTIILRYVKLIYKDVNFNSWSATIRFCRYRCYSIHTVSHDAVKRDLKTAPNFS